MTRRGITPYLQSHFQSALTILGRREEHSDWEILVELGRLEDVWDEWSCYYLQYSQLGYKELKALFQSDGPIKLEPYLEGGNKIEENLEAFSLILNTDTRTRGFVAGTMSKRVDEPQVTFFVEVEIDLDHIRGEVMVEPLIAVARDLVDPTSGVRLKRGTIVGSTQALRLSPEKKDHGLADLFAFEWLHFGEGNDFSPGDEYALNIADHLERPQIILNESIVNFHGVLDTPNQPKGRPSTRLKTRRVLDTQIAIGVLQECGSYLIGRIRSLAASEHVEGAIDTIHEELSEMELQLISAYSHFFSPRGVRTDIQDVCRQVAGLSDAASMDFLTNAMPRRIRRELRAEDAVQVILDLGLSLADDWTGP